MLSDGSRWQVYKRVFEPDELLADELGGDGSLRRRTGSSSSGRDDAATARSPRSSETTAAAARAPRPASTSSRCRSSRAAPASAPTSTARRRASSRREEGRPWRGRAGKTLRGWLGLDEDAFYDTFYCAAVTRCYPGKPPSGRGDRTPTPKERALCAVWREHELRLLRPALVVTVGGLAARALLGETSLTACIGTKRELDGAAAIPLPHPSGASGWLNSPAQSRAARPRDRARPRRARSHRQREARFQEWSSRSETARRSFACSGS